MVRYSLAAFLLLIPVRADAPKGKPHVAVIVTVREDGTRSVWCPCAFTTYADEFEGRRTASGSRFSHRSRFVACRSGAFGTTVRFRYRSVNGRWHESTGIIADRGALPLHRTNRPQFDLPKRIAGELGLYRSSGKDYRHGEWRME